MGKKQYYVVAKGRQTGIFRSWNECENQVKGFPNAVFKGFERYEDADSYLSQQSRSHHTHAAPQHKPSSHQPLPPYNHGDSAMTASSIPPRTHHRTPQLPATASSSPAAAAATFPSSQLPFAPSNRLSASSLQPFRHSASPYDRPAPKLHHAHFSTTASPPSLTPLATAASSPSSAVASTPTAKYAIVYCDGAAKNNPKGPMGCGGIMYDSNSHGDQLAEMSTFKQFLGYGSNNESEYHGLIIGMELALKNGVTHLVVKMDSELVAKQMTGDYQVKAANLKVLYMRALDFASRFKDIKIQHVLRHENSLADSLANESIYQRDR